MNFTPNSSSKMFDSLYLRSDERKILKIIDLESNEINEALSLNCNGFLSDGDLLRYKSTILKSFKKNGFNPKDTTILDLGCGVGSIGIWLSEQIKCNLIGIDFSRIAIKNVLSTVSSKNLDNLIEFKVADFAETGLENESVSAIISLDALYLYNKPIAALNEIHRILICGGLLIFTTYITQPEHNNLSPDTHSIDWLSLLPNCGFGVEIYNDVSCIWRKKMKNKHKYRLHEKNRIIAEMGVNAQAELAVSETMLGLHGSLSFLDRTSRFEIIARRL